MFGGYRKSSLFFCFLLLILGTSVARAQAFRRTSIGDTPDSIKLKDTLGLELDTLAFRGNVLGLVFIKHPSLRCPDILKVLQRVTDQYSESHGFQTVVIYCPRSDTPPTNSELDDLAQMLEESRVTLPVLIDEGLVLFNKWGAITFPSFALLDKDGAVTFIQGGLPTFGGEKNLVRNIEKHLGIVHEEKVVKKTYAPKGKSGFYYNLAAQTYKRGGGNKSIKYLEKAIKQDKNYSKPYVLYAKIFQEKGKLDQAVKKLEQALACNESDAEARILYAFIQHDMKNFDAAVLQFEILIEKNPEMAANAYFGLGTIYNSNQKLDGAIEKLNKAIDLFVQQVASPEYRREIFNFNEALAYAELATIYIKQKDNDQAISAYQQAGRLLEMQLKVAAIKKKALSRH